MKVVLKEKEMLYTDQYGEAAFVVPGGSFTIVDLGGGFYTIDDAILKLDNGKNITITKGTSLFDDSDGSIWTSEDNGVDLEWHVRSFIIVNDNSIFLSLERVDNTMITCVLDKVAVTEP